MPYTVLDLAHAYLQSGEVAEALETLEMHLDSEPHDDEARRLHAAILMRMAGDSERRAALADLVRLKEPTADDYWQQALLLNDLHEPDAAIHLIIRARAARPGDERLVQQHILLLMANDRFADARVLLDTMPQTWLWLQLSGDLAAEYDGAARAVQDYTLALEQLAAHGGEGAAVGDFIENFRARLYASRARVYTVLGRLADADADYARAQSIVPGDPMFPFLRGLIAAQQGQLADALALCGQALTAAPVFLRDQMEETLRSDPRYVALAMLLLQGDADI